MPASLQLSAASSARSAASPEVQLPSYRSLAAGLAVTAAHLAGLSRALKRRLVGKGAVLAYCGVAVLRADSMTSYCWVVTIAWWIARRCCVGHW